MPEIRCGTKKFAEITENGILEIFCRSSFCKDREGDEIIIHRFDLNQLDENGNIKLVETIRLKRPK